jgi:signal transduction histidine kinase
MSLIYQLIYIITGFLTVAVSVGLFLKRPKSSIVQAFSGLAMAAAAWAITLFALYMVADPVPVLVMGRLNYVFAEVTAALLFLFANLFPKKLSLPRWLLYLVMVETMILAVVTLSTSLIDESEVVLGVSRLTVFGPLYAWFVLHFVGLAVALGMMFVQKYRRLTGALREQLVGLVGGCFVAVFIGVMTNFLIPLLTGLDDTQHLGPVALLIFIGAATYSTAKVELFNLRIFSTELLVSLVTLLLVINTVLITETDQRFFSVFILMVGTAAGFYLIYSVRREVAARERLDAVRLDLVTASTQLQEMDDIKNEFIIMASHQLRTPITLVKGYLSLMMEGAYGAVPEAFKEKLTQMFSLNERLVQMIDNMLNVARIEKRKIEYNVERVDILTIARAVSEDMRIKLGDKRLKISLSMPEQPVMAYVDEKKFEEVLTNLIDNAIKYTDTGEIAMDVRDDDGTGYVTVTVRDSGIGMSPEEAGRVFTKFFRAKEAVIREPGTGLGLYICAKLMNGMGGQIRVVETTTGYGTTFEVRLPTRQRDPNLPLN